LPTQLVTVLIGVSLTMIVLLNSSANLTLVHQKKESVLIFQKSVLLFGILSADVIARLILMIVSGWLLKFLKTVKVLVNLYLLDFL